MDLGLVEKAALVTGASVGIGAEIARALVAENVRVATVARRIGLLRNNAAEVAKQFDAPMFPIEADLTRPASAKAVVELAVAAIGPIDILVNCAGGSRPAGLESDDDLWDEAFELNFSSARRLASAVLPGMLQRGWGRIINISGIIEPRKLGAATAAKAALHVWAKGLACDVAANGVTVNCIQPGRVESEQILERVHPTEESRRQFAAQHIPAGHFGVPADVAALAVFLASPRSSYITGTSIPVDGGMRYGVL